MSKRIPQLVLPIALASLALTSTAAQAAPELDILASAGFDDALGGRAVGLDLGGDDLIVLVERGGAGSLVRIDRAGERTALHRLAARVDDLAVDRRDGTISVLGAAGLQVFDAGFTPVWQRSLPSTTPGKLAIGELGTIAALVGHELRTFSADGAPLGAARLNDDVTRDLAVFDTAGLVITAGWNLRSACDTELDLASLSAFAFDGAPQWRAYGDTTPADLCGDRLDNLASTRAVAVRRGDDGLVYLLAEVDGRNNIFRARPGRSDLAASNVAFDAYTDPETARPAQHAYFARFTTSGEHLLGQYFLLPAEGSVVHPRSIAADRHGNVYLAGSASHTLGAADEIAVSEALDGLAGFFSVVEPDFEARHVWQQLDADDTRSELSQLVLDGDRVLTLLHAEHDHTDGPVPSGPSIVQWDGGFGPLAVEKRPDPETQGTFGYESGVSGADPTCYCDSRSAPNPATFLGLGLFVLVTLPRRRPRC